MIRLGILDDNVKIRRLLKSLLENEEGFTVNQSYGSGEAFIENANFMELDVVVSDIGLPGMSGIEFVHRVKLQYPHINIIMFTVFEDSDKLFLALRAGATGYLLKDSSMEDLKEGIVTVMQGGAVMGPGIAQKLLTFFAEPKAVILDEYALTDREIEIAELVLQGYKNKQLADKIFISVETVKWHIKNMYQKLAVSNREDFMKKIEGKK
jgi:DNA-binding NarL/FixJ family response regulator